MLLPACSTVRSSTESNHLQLSTRLQRDSIWLHDSVSYTYRPAKISLPCWEGVGEGSPPDTVYLEKWHTRWRDRETVRTDTVTQTVTKTETVWKPYVPAVYKYCAAFAVLFVLFILGRLSLYIKKRF